MLQNLGTGRNNNNRANHIKSMITEQYKDCVYFSSLFMKDYPDEYRQIREILKQNKVGCKALRHTKDYWCRDYMPVQQQYNNFVQFRYDPDYLKNDSRFKTDTTSVLNSLHFKPVYEPLPLIMDGGNVVACETGIKTANKTYADDNEVAIIMTEKIFSENPHFSHEEILNMLHNAFKETEIILLPWDQEDVCGHTDGLIHNVGYGKVLVNLELYSPQIASEMRRILNTTFEVIDLKLSNYHEYSWAYINMLQTRDVIIVPGIGLPQDMEALEQIKNLHPDYEDRIYQVNLAPVIKKWNGALNCLTWTVSTEMSKLYHSKELDNRFKNIIENKNIYSLSDDDIKFAGDYNPTRLPCDLEKLYWGF